MKKISALLMATAFVLALPAGATGLKSEEPVNTEKSKVKWLGKKVGGEHWGYIDIKSGSFSISDGKLSAGTVTIDMTSIVNKDLEGEWNKKLVDHLKSDDFFGTATYKQAVFKTNSVKALGSGQYTVSGDLTIKGKTHPNSFEVTMSGTEGSYKITGKLHFDRSKYDVRYGSKSFFNDLGDKAIEDKVELEFEVYTK